MSGGIPRRRIFFSGGTKGRCVIVKRRERSVRFGMEYLLCGALAPERCGVTEENVYVWQEKEAGGDKNI